MYVSYLSLFLNNQSISVAWVCALTISYRNNMKIVHTCVHTFAFRIPHSMWSWSARLVGRRHIKMWSKSKSSLHRFEYSSVIWLLYMNAATLSQQSRSLDISVKLCAIKCNLRENWRKKCAKNWTDFFWVIYFFSFINSTQFSDITIIYNNCDCGFGYEVMSSELEKIGNRTAND